MTQKEEQKIFNDYQDLCIREAQKQEEKNNKVFKELQNIITKYKFKKIIEFLEDINQYYLMKIVNKKDVFGEKQDEPYWFKYIYITQSCGYTGDDFSGTIFIPLGKEKDKCKYLKFEYNF